MTGVQTCALPIFTHELKTPIASIRLYLQTLQSRQVDEARRREFYEIMLEDADRLHRTVEQVLKAGASGQKAKIVARAPVDMAALGIDAVVAAAPEPLLAPDRMYWRALWSSEDPCYGGSGGRCEESATGWSIVGKSACFFAGFPR